MIDTEELCTQNSELIDAINNTVANSFVVYEEDKVDISAKPWNTKIIISNKRSFEAAKAYKWKKIAVLDFANNHSPWWAPHRSWAQEECLCRCSTLYPCLIWWDNYNKFYQRHIDQFSHWEIDSYGNDDILYLPDIIVFKSDEDIPLLQDKREWFKVDVIVSAAPELYYAGNYQNQRLENALKSRIKHILDVAYQQQIEVLILWAFWCWAFHNPPEIVAKLFKEELVNYDFETIEFAIYTNRHWPKDNYSIFKEIFLNEDNYSNKGIKDTYNLERFKEAQSKSYRTALKEIKHWRKETHWMWYIFPQIEGLGQSEISKKYAITSLEEAKAYLKDDELREHLIEISLALLDLKENVSEDIFWIIDAMKLQSCMTLFAQAEPNNDIFTSVLNKFYDWEFDLKTLSILWVLWEELHAKIEKRKYSWKEIWKDSEEYKQLKEKRDSFVKKIKM